MQVYPKLTRPKITVVICNYNYDKYISLAIDSVISQSYPAHQIIVVDDGSTDSSHSLIKAYKDKLLFLPKTNGGQISAYNFSFKHISGDVVLFLDADDELLPTALEKVATCFNENVVKVQFKMRIIDYSDNTLDVMLPSHLDSGDHANDLIVYGMMYKSPPASGNAYRVETLYKLFPLPVNSEEKHGADYFCIYGISIFGKIASINQTLFNYRIHDSSKNISTSLGFGNAIKKHDRLKVSLRRWEMFREWIKQRTNGEIILPERFIDFTQQKYFYAVDVINANTLKQRYYAATKHFRWLIQSIWHRRDFNFLKKIILVCWMVLVLVTPKSTSIRIARKVCNPI